MATLAPYWSLYIQMNNYQTKYKRSHPEKGGGGGVGGGGIPIH